VTTSARALEIGERTVAPGTSAYVSLPVFRDIDGSDVAVPLRIVHGAAPGPSLTLLSMLHGDEWSMLEVLADLVSRVDAKALRGTLLIVPIANPYAFRQLRRTSRETLEFDSSDLNRTFPGDETWLTRRIASVISREVLARATHLIDFHPGPFGSAWMQVIAGRDLPGDLAERSEAMAVAFGVGLISRSAQLAGIPGPRSASAYAATALGVPSIIAEVGGLGFGAEHERRWREQNVDGVLGVMRSLSMLEDATYRAPATPRRTYVRDWIVRPTTSGLLVPHIGAERLATEVAKGELLGRVISPSSFEVLETLTAPRDGVLFCVARSYPVQPHNYAFGAADLSDADTGRTA
jgi:predicted deacylase